MSERDPDVVVRRQGTEGLSTTDYADELRTRLPGAEVAHAPTPAAERRLVPRATVVTGKELEPELVGESDSLRLFACTSAGTDHVDVDGLRDRGVAVTNASGIHAPGIAEQIVGNIVVFSRQLHEGWRRNQNREWRHFQPDELTEKTVTVVGLGAIGRATVERLAGFDVHTVGVRYTPEKGGPTDEIVGFDDDDVHEALARTDYLVLACPLTDLTRGLVDEKALATLPPQAVVVNVARGGVIETDALVEALQREGIRGAALDVTDPEPLPESHPLWTLENCLITPHVGGHTPRHWDRLAGIVARNVEHLRSGGDASGLENLVTAPGQSE